jgi:hypothetical protein
MLSRDSLASREPLAMSIAENAGRGVEASVIGVNNAVTQEEAK